MIIVRSFIDKDAPAAGKELTVALPFDLRKKSRLKVISTCGKDVGIQLPRGSELRDGDRLQADTGEQVLVRASEEKVSTVTAPDSLLLLRAAYHLGNRHVPLQVTEGWLRYQHDHVLDDMVIGLGLTVNVEGAPFQPESGAYHRHGSEVHHHDHGEGHHSHD